MTSARLIKRRIKSAKNIAQITRAMQMMAASKMKKAQVLAVSGRPYADKIAEMVSRFVISIDREMHPLLHKNNNGSELIILVSTNKGLCGGLNTNLFRSLVKWFTQEEFKNAKFITVGKKGVSFIVRNQNNLIADFSDKIPFTSNISALTTLITQGYIKGEYKQVYLIYNNFISALAQIPQRKKILPIADFFSGMETANVKAADTKTQYLIEPSVDDILDTLLFHYLENQIRDALLQAEASEHSARMFAMKNATDNALELIDILTLDYNKARQEKITYEIADIVTARIAVE